MICIDAVFKTINIAIEFDSTFLSLFSFCSDFIAFSPKGVAAFPNPKRFAIIFIEISLCASSPSLTSGNNFLKIGFNSFVNLFIIDVTRLDKDTSGVCIFAKHPYIQELFNLKKEEMKLNKEYIAVVNGKIKDRGIIEAPISRKVNTIILREVRSDGKYAKTEFERLEYIREKDYSVVKIKLYTGRTHQIRVHMSYIGHTLLGDDLYAKESEKENILKLIKRQALHCDKISFRHPVTGKSLTLLASIPNDILALIGT